MNIPLNIDWQQIVLHLMNFAILAGGLYFLLYNPVKKFMAKRAEYYENMDKEANEKLESATIKEAEYQKHMEELEAELDGCALKLFLMQNVKKPLNRQIR